MKKITFIILLILALCEISFSQEKLSNSTYENEHLLFPDEFSELDEIPIPISTNDEYVLATLEAARYKYVKAIMFEGNGRVDEANKLYLEALDEINTLGSYPGINQNPDFIDLGAQLVEDYENFAIKNEILDENAPIFLIKDKFFDDVENQVTLSGAELTTLKDDYLARSGAKAFTYDDFEISMEENEAVKKSIKWLTETNLGRRVMKLWLERSSRFFPMMRRIAKEENVPEEIIYLSMIESGLNPHAVSKASAVGLWQFMEATGKEYGLNSEGSIWIDERRDPEKATRASMRFLKDLYARFGDWHLALASYNCGGGRVNRAIRRTGMKNPSYWDVRKRLPKETRHYVPRYIATALISMEPEAYGFVLDTFNFRDEYKYDIFPLNEPVNISVLAKCAGVTDSVIKALNPELIKSSTPPNISNYNLKIPLNSTKTFATNFASLTKEEKQPYVEHKIQRYESISKIATKYEVSKAELVALNGYRSSRTKLRKGNIIKIPVSANKYDEINLAANRSGTYFPMDGSTDIIHKVRSGESLYLIAKKYGVTVGHIRRMNGMSSNASNLRIGQRLMIAKRDPKKAKEKKKTVEPELLESPIIVRHKVKPGERLSDLATLYKIEKDDIIETNKLKSDKLKIGSYLKIKTKVNINTIKENSPEPSFDVAYHTVKRGETLGQIADRYGMSLRNLKLQNGLRNDRIYPGQRIKVLSSYTPSSNDFVGDLPETHKVRKGESVYKIATKYGMTVGQLKAANGMTSDFIYPGQRLKVAAGKNQPKNITSNNSKRKSNPTNFAVHTVKSGETLGQIAENYGVRAQEIRNWNGMSGSLIHVGDKLKIASNNTNNLASSDFKTHVVRKGESIGLIAAKYGVTETELRNWNNKSSNKILVGEKLNVKEPEMYMGSGKSNSKSKNVPSYYNLKKGENLYIVAKKFGLSLNQIKKLNPNINEKRLQIGQKIRIK
jgi:membrane-bound lytic murein transglycosylase D